MTGGPALLGMRIRNKDLGDGSRSPPGVAGPALGRTCPLELPCWVQAWLGAYPVDSEVHPVQQGYAGDGVNQAGARDIRLYQTMCTPANYNQKWPGGENYY